MTGRKVFITGGSGFIGRALARRYRKEGWDTCGVDLSGDRELDVDAADISEIGPWQEMVAGADTVIHTAALVSNTATLGEAWAVNVRGTRNLLEAAASAKVRRCVVFSSGAVYSSHRDGVVDENRPVRPSGDAYGDTKIAAEQVCLQMHAEGRIDVTILRPGSVYGPESRPWTVIPVQMLRAGQVVLPAMGKGIFVKIYVDDLVDLVRLAADSEAASGQVFNATDNAAVTTREFFGHYCRMLGIGPPRIAPTPVAVALATVIGTGMRAVGKPSEATAATMRMLAGTGTISSDKAARVLGWSPKVDIDEGMARTEVWLREQGHLGV